MKVALIISKKDIASVNIKNRLLKKDFKKIGTLNEEHYYKLDNYYLFTFNKESVMLENVDNVIEKEVGEIDLFLFCTRHQSRSGIPSLSVHTQGNWSKAEYGGKDKTLSIAPANILKKALFTLEKNKLDGFDIVQEATHHGPDTNKPTMFIEIGSTKEEWNRIDAADVIVKTIFEVFESDIPNEESALGIGGMHTTPIFKKYISKNNIALGHACPKYILTKLDEDLIKQAIDRTIPKATHVILDWKGLGKEKERIKTMLDNMCIKYERA